MTHSFPTRRSSDLKIPFQPVAAARIRVCHSDRDHTHSLILVSPSQWNVRSLLSPTCTGSPSLHSRTGSRHTSGILAAAKEGALSQYVIEHGSASAQIGGASWREGGGQYESIPVEAVA